MVWFYEYAQIDIQLNGQTLCTAFTDQGTLFGYGQSTCSAAAYATEGLYHENMLDKYYNSFSFNSQFAFFDRRHGAGCLYTGLRHDSIVCCFNILPKRLYWIQDLSQV